MNKKSNLNHYIIKILSILVIMTLRKRHQEQTTRLQVMGWTLIGFAFICSACAYFIPTDETIFWLSSANKEGIYALSGFFTFLGFYCLGAIWRKRHFI
jgi:uncharacterized membrane protein YkgB